MEERIAILTDSSSLIYRMEYNYKNLFMIDLPCFIGEEVFTDFAVNKDEPFYSALAKTDLVARTSQPSPGETLDMFEKIKKLGYTTIIFFPISRPLSGTYENAMIASEMISDVNVIVVDIKTTVSILGSIAIEAARMANENYCAEDIVNRGLEISSNSSYYLTVNDLRSLIQNGRLSNAKGFVANILRIKPVIHLDDEGKLVAIESIRTFRRAINRLVELVEENIDRETGVVHISYSGNEDHLQIALSLVEERLPNLRKEIFTIPATVVAHTGLSSIGIGYINY